MKSKLQFPGICLEFPGGIGWNKLMISGEIEKAKFSIRKLSEMGYPWLLCSQTFLVYNCIRYLSMVRKCDPAVPWITYLYASSILHDILSLIDSTIVCWKPFDWTANELTWNRYLFSCIVTVMRWSKNVMKNRDMCICKANSYFAMCFIMDLMNNQ